MPHANSASGPFYHATRADLAPGDRLAPGGASSYADRKLSWIDFSGPFDAAIWGCELAKGERTTGTGAITEKFLGQKIPRKRYWLPPAA